jgi:hypothetical protein
LIFTNDKNIIVPELKNQCMRAIFGKGLFSRPTFLPIFQTLCKIIIDKFELPFLAPYHYHALKIWGFL